MTKDEEYMDEASVMPTYWTARASWANVRCQRLCSMRGVAKQTKLQSPNDQNV